MRGIITEVSVSTPKLLTEEEIIKLGLRQENELKKKSSLIEKLISKIKKH